MHIDYERGVVYCIDDGTFAWRRPWRCGYIGVVPCAEHGGSKRKGHVLVYWVPNQRRTLIGVWLEGELVWHPFPLLEDLPWAYLEVEPDEVQAIRDIVERRNGGR